MIGALLIRGAVKQQAIAWTTVDQDEYRRRQQLINSVVPVSSSYVWFNVPYSVWWLVVNIPCQFPRLNSCYECLSGGLTSEALTDFTGGMVERFTLRDETRNDLVRRMLRAQAMGSLSGCSIDVSIHYNDVNWTSRPLI